MTEFLVRHFVKDYEAVEKICGPHCIWSVGEYGGDCL